MLVFGVFYFDQFLVKPRSVAVPLPLYLADHAPDFSPEAVWQVRQNALPHSLFVQRLDWVEFRNSVVHADELPPLSLSNHSDLGVVQQFLHRRAQELYPQVAALLLQQSDFLLGHFSFELFSLSFYYLVVDVVFFNLNFLSLCNFSLHQLFFGFLKFCQSFDFLFCIGAVDEQVLNLHILLVAQQVLRECRVWLLVLAKHRFVLNSIYMSSFLE